MRKLPFLPDCRLPSSDQVQWKQPACCASPNNWATPSDSSQANSNGRGTPWVSGRDASSNDASASSVSRRLQDPRCRSEERRVGHESVSTCKSRWSPDHTKKKKTISQYNKDK